MNSRNLFKMMIALMALIITMGACNKNQEQSKSDPKKIKDAPLDPSGKLTIKYIEEDSILKNYNLAKDFQEMETRLQNEYDQAGQRLSNQIASFENSMKQKYENNQYTEASYNADMQRLQMLQQNAQNELAKLQENGANQVMESQKQLKDSVENFLREYANAHHYDMILIKQPGSFINSNLDVTDEVVKELNKRYTKVAPKQ